MNEVVTDQARADIATARNGGTAMPQITQMAWGTGGHVAGDPTTPVPPSPTDIALETEVLRKAVARSLPNTTTVRYAADIGAADAGMVGQTITEVGLFDATGKLVIRATFPGKTIDADTTLNFSYDEQF